MEPSGEPPNTASVRREAARPGGVRIRSVQLKGKQHG